MLREILKPLVPKDISHAPKRALQTPQREWLGNELSDFTGEHLNKLKHSPAASWFDFDEMEKEWRAYKAGDIESSFHIWQWVNASLLFADKN